MVDKEVKLSSKYQIVIPKEAREYLGLRAGDKLVLEGSGRKLILWKAPRNYTSYMAGLHKEVWQGVNVDKYIADLRKEWGRKKK